MGGKLSLLSGEVCRNTGNTGKRNREVPLNRQKSAEAILTGSGRTPGRAERQVRDEIGKFARHAKTAENLARDLPTTE